MERWGPVCHSARVDTSRRDAPRSYYGWTRYSAYVPDHRGLAFRATRVFPDERAYLDYLWSAQRMATRQQIFLTLSVPLLQRMRERHDYRHVVTYSPEMPEPWQSALHEAAQRFDVLDLRPAAEGVITDIMATDLTERGLSSRKAVWFRVDDDDLLSADYLDFLDEHVTAHGPDWAVSLAKGVAGVWHDGRLTDLRGTHRPLGSQGLACIGWWDGTTRELTVPDVGNHSTTDWRMPTVLDSRRATFLQLLHAGQDTRTQAPPSLAELQRIHQRNKAVVTKPDRVVARFPTIAAVYRPETAG